MRNRPSIKNRRNRAVRFRTGKRILCSVSGCLMIALLAVPSLTGGGEDRLLEVSVSKASIRLEPGETSPLVAELDRGTIITLASRVKLNRAWLYVRFESAKSGRILSGYVLETSVRRLFPVVKWTHIFSEGEVMNPRELDLTSSDYLPSIEWGTGADRLIAAEGRPYKQEAVPHGEILQYRRDIVNKRCLVEYLLVDNRLVTTRFYLLERYVDKSLYIREYNQVKAYLTQKLGIPRADRMTWLDPTSRSEDGLWGQALSNGQVKFAAEWVFRGTEVLLTLANIQHSVVFGAEASDLTFKNPASF